MLSFPRMVNLLAICVCLAYVQPASAQTQTLSEELAKEIVAIADSRTAFVSDYVAGNVDGIVGAYDDDATFAGTLQPFWLEGLDAIADLWQRYFAAWPQRNLIFRQPAIRFYGDASVETGYMEMYMSRPGAGTIATYIRYSITRIKTDEGWKIVNMHVTKLPGTK